MVIEIEPFDALLNSHKPRYFILYITPRGEKTARCIQRSIDAEIIKIGRDNRIKDAIKSIWQEADGIICVMACGIVVRGISELLNSKLNDPALVVVDEAKRFSISLLSGHFGGANELSRQVANAIGAIPVITTATDVNGLVALDDIARKKKLTISNIERLKAIHMEMLMGNKVYVYDPFNIMSEIKGKGEICYSNKELPASPASISKHIVYVHYKRPVLNDKLSGSVLNLYPPLLAIGIGCNRGASKDEIIETIREILSSSNIAIESAIGLFTSDRKQDEEGLLQASKALRLPIKFFTSKELSKVSVPNPSPAPLKAIGVHSVCEASAILGADNGELIVEKTKGKNVTLAIAVKRHPPLRFF